MTTVNRSTISAYEPLSDEEAEEKVKNNGVGRICEVSKPERPYLCCGFILLVFQTLLRLVQPILLGAVAVAVVSSSGGDDKRQLLVTFLCDLSPWDCDEPEGLLNTSVIALVAVAFLTGIVVYWTNFIFDMTGQRVVARLRRNLFNSLLLLEIGFFDQKKTGELVNRLSSDTNVIKNAATEELAIGVSTLMTCLGSIAYNFVLSWKLSFAMLAVVPAVAILLTWFARRYRKLSRLNQDKLAEASDVAEETFSLIRTVRAFSQHAIQRSDYSSKVQETYENGILMARAFSLFRALFTFLFVCSTCFVLWFGCIQVIHGHMSAGELTTFVFFTMNVGFTLARLAGSFAIFAKAVGALETVFELVDRTPKVQNVDGIKPANFRGKVEFVNVQFSYPTRPDETVLQNLNLTLYPNEITALVGPSGHGKSTIVNLMLRFYDVTGGEILVDGVNIKQYNLDWLRWQMATVQQEPVLFAKTIRDNILFGSTGEENIAEERIISAARVANAERFISEFADKYETIVGERGVRLSGGQKQRIAIARAVLRDPAVLLLDEATSSLDSESEFVVQQALDNLMKTIKRTCLVIAHRLSTVKDANRIYVIEHGTVAETGTHDDLMKNDGVYAQLVSRQLQDVSVSL